jgi:hypothetical protein
MTTVSNRPSSAPTFSNASTRASRTPRLRATSTAVGEIYCHDFAAARLQFERDASRAAASVEDAPAHET